MHTDDAAAFRADRAAYARDMLAVSTGRAYGSRTVATKATPAWSAPVTGTRPDMAARVRETLPVPGGLAMPVTLADVKCWQAFDLFSARRAMAILDAARADGRMRAAQYARYAARVESLTIRGGVAR